jgi:D-alanine-D-alanine ligase
MQKIKIGIFFGGISPEHEVSLMSARGIILNIDRSKFRVKEVWIDKKGRFWTGADVLKKAEHGKTRGLASLDLNSLSGMIDVAFPVLHGKGGEDGTIQGLFETLKIPYVGADVAASAVCLDKGLFNQLMVAHHIPKPDFVVLDYARDSKLSISQSMRYVRHKMGWPVFVKPVHTGSSVGISKAKKSKNLTEALRLAKQYDTKIIVEQSVENCTEVEVSVLGNSKKNYAVSLPGRVIPHSDFYDYDDKYKNGKAQFEIPVKLPEKKIKEIQNIALQAYQIANCCGFARVDFLLDKNLGVYLNEINTIPGFTPISMYPKLWSVIGLSYKRLITKLIGLAMEK